MGSQSIPLLRLAGWLMLAFVVPSARASPRQPLRGSVPAECRGLTPIGEIAPDTPLRLSIGLPLRNGQALTNYLRQLYAPRNANYHHYLTPRQFADQFGPSEKDYRAVIDYAKASGFTVKKLYPNRTLLDVSAPASAIQRAFRVNLHRYRHPVEPRAFYAPDAEPALDLEVPILAISGLDNYVLPRPYSRKVGIVSGRPTPFGNGTGPGGVFMGPDFRAAYAPNTILTGSGQIVGLVEFDGYYTNDVAAYELLAGLPNVPLTNILVDGFDGTPVSAGGNLEATLDIDMAIAMAPGLSAVMVYETGGGESTAPANTLLNQMATDDLAGQISSSWGFAINASTEQILLQFAAQGQTFFQASGDGGAYGGPIMPPSDDPNLTIVGGTMLLTSSPGGPWRSEAVWNDAEGGASGGGVSASYPIPFWQQPVSMAANGGSAVYRNIPDVAMVASNIAVVAQSETNAVQGTSCAAPLWAGFAALANELAASNGQPRIGFLNPALYAIGLSSNYTADFHDVTSGNNEGVSSTNEFFARSGYDLCTGWGSPAGSNLIAALAEPALPILNDTTNPPIVTGQPGDETVLVGGSVSLQVLAAGTAPLTFHWQENGTNLGDGPGVSGAATGALTLTEIASNASFTVVVSNDYGLATSAPVSVNVYRVPPTGQLVTFDDITNLFPEAPLPSPYGGLTWYNFNAANDTNELQYLPGGWNVAMISAPNVAYNNNGSAAISANGTFSLLSAYVTALYTNSLRIEIRGYKQGALLYDTTNTLTDASPSFVTFDFVGVDEVDFLPAIGGIFGEFAVDNLLYSNSVPYLGAPVIAAQPVSRLAPAGGDAVFNVAALGGPPFTYQWQFDGTNLADAGDVWGSLTSSLTVANASLADAGTYSVLVSNAFGSVESSNVLLTVFPVPPGGVMMTFDDLAAPTSGLAIPQQYFGFAWSGFSAVDGVDYANSGFNAAVVSPGNVAVNLSGGTASMSATQPFGLVSACLTAAWLDNLRVVAKGYLAGQLVFNVTNTINASGPTLVNFNSAPVDHVYFSPSGGAPHPGYIGSGEVFALDDLVVITGNIYSGPPIIETQPTPQMAMDGGWAMFSVAASGGELSCQWQLNGTNLADGNGVSGSLTATLSLNNISTNNLALYSVVVSNGAGQTQSAGASLRICEPSGPAQLFTFDDLLSTTNGTALPAGYAGFYWSGFGVMDGVDYPEPGGFGAGVVSSNNVAYGAGGSPATLSSLTRYSLLTAYVTAAWNDNLQLEAKGYAGGVLLYDTTNTLSAAAPTLVAFNYAAVDAVVFTASGGMAHAGYAGTGPAFVMDNVLVTTNTTVLGPPVITSQPSLLVVPYGLGAPAVFQVGAQGSAPLSYSWRQNGLPINGLNQTNPVLTVHTVGSSMTYSVIVSNAYGAVTSSNTPLMIIPSGAIAVTFDNLPASETGLPVPSPYMGLTWSNFSELDALDYPGSSGFAAGMISLSNAAFNANGNVAVISCPLPITVDYFVLTSAFNDNLQVEVQGYSNGYTGPSLVFDLTNVLSPSYPQVAVDPAPGGFLPASSAVTKVIFTASGGTPQPGLAGSGEQFVLDDFCFTPSSTTTKPTIWVQPESQTVPWGATVNFQTVATAISSLSYQWALNGTNVPLHGTASTLSLTNVETVNAGTYTVTVSDSYGSVKSAGAVLIVTVPSPQIQVVGQTSSSLTLKWNTTFGLKCQMQYATNLSQSSWVNTGPVISPIGTNYQTSVAVGSSAQRFYRVIVTH